MADFTQSQRIGGEEVRCYECSNIWPREHGGLQCPRCDSEFVEIISDSTPPSPEITPQALPTASSDDVHWASSGSAESFEHHNPWRDLPAPGQDDMRSSPFGGGPQQPGNYHWQTRSPNGTSSFSVSVFSSNGGPLRFAPNGHATNGSQHDPARAQVGQDFGELLQNVMGLRSPPEARSPARSPFPGRGPTTPMPGFFSGFRGQQQQPQQDQQQHFGHPGTPLFTLLNTLFPNMGGQAQQGFAGPSTGVFGMLRQVMDPANASHGDAVFTQEALDRIVSELMEQTQGRHGAGPASDAAIQSLPKQKVSESMLDEKGKAECSICMDSVALGEIVTALPCTHWFHEACITAWLKEHDTCPHCRKGITPQPAPPSDSSQQHSSSHSSSRPSRRRSTNSMPGAWHSSRSGSLQSPTVSEDSTSPRQADREHYPDYHRRNHQHQEREHRHNGRNNRNNDYYYSHNNSSTRHQSEPLPNSSSPVQRRRPSQSHRHSSYNYSNRRHNAGGSNTDNSNRPRGLSDWVRSFTRNDGR